MTALLRIIAFVLRLPDLFDRIKDWWRVRKIQKLESLVAEKDAILVSNRVAAELKTETADKVKEVTEDAETKTITDIADYFNTPK